MDDKEILDTIARVRSTFPHSVGALGEALTVLDEFERRIAASSDTWDNWPAEDEICTR